MKFRNIVDSLVSFPTIHMYLRQVRLPTAVMIDCFLNPFMAIWNNCFLSRQLNYKNWSQNIFLNFYQWPDVIQINIGLLIQNSAVQLVLYFWHASSTPEGNGDCCERRGDTHDFQGEWREDQLSRTEYKGGTILKIDSKLTANEEGFKKYFRVLGKFYRDNTKILQPPPP